MANLGPRGGQNIRRVRSASFSSDSSFGGAGGGAPLNADLSDLNLSDNSHHRSAEEFTTRVGKPAASVASSDSFIEDIRESFQIGKPPQDDEAVFDTSLSTSQQLITGPIPIITKEEVSTSKAIVPIQAQLSPAERRHLVQGVDAQTYYPAEACIFVANLPESKSDTALEVAITKAFSTFGPVFVKIRRDPKNMPFAFCQYTDANHAQIAQREGKGLLVEGRPCRTEMVKANRSYVMYHRKGHQVSISEARDHLLQFGDISKLEALREDAAQTMKLPGAVFVEYLHFDPGRDIISAYRYNDDYGVVAYDLKKVNANQVNHHANFLARYEVDRRSIYVGNLPYNVENIDEVLRHAASVAGTVEAVQVIRKEARNEGGRPTVFAFVEYSRPDEALVAVERLRGTFLVNSRIRVEKKKCIDQGSQFRGGEHVHVERNEAAVSRSVHFNEDRTAIAPATPARPIITGGVGAASGSGTGVGRAGSRLISPDTGYHPVVFPPRRTITTPTAYNRGRTFVSPDHGYQPSTLRGPGSVAYGQAQYISPNQAYHPPPAQYMSPNYALSTGYQQRSYGQGAYSPATPQVLGGAHTQHTQHTPYHGSGGGYFPGQMTPYWKTPYLQDQNDGIQYYAGYGPPQYTPLAARSVSVMNAADVQTPTRQTEPGPEHKSREARKQPNEGGDQTTGEKK